MLIQVQYEAVVVGAAATIDVRAERVRLLPSMLSGKLGCWCSGARSEETKLPATFAIHAALVETIEPG